MINDLQNTFENIEGFQPKCYLFDKEMSSLKSAALSQNPLHEKFKYKILWMSGFRLSKYCNQ